MFPTRVVYFEKHNKKDRPPCSLKRYDGPVLPQLFLNTRVVHQFALHFAVATSKGLKQYLIGRKARAHGAM